MIEFFCCCYDKQLIHTKCLVCKYCANTRVIALCCEEICKSWTIEKMLLIIKTHPVGDINFSNLPLNAITVMTQIVDIFLLSSFRWFRINVIIVLELHYGYSIRDQI